MKTGLSAILSYDPLAAGTGMADYTTAVSQNLAAFVTLGPWTSSGTPEVWTASGQTIQGGYPSTCYAARNGTEAWRILYFDQLSTTPRQIVEPHLNEALFASARIYLGR